MAGSAKWTKKLSHAQAAASEKEDYTILKTAALDAAKAGHLHDYMIEAGNTEIPWWVTLPANAVPSAWVGLALDELVAALDGSGAAHRQTLTEAAGTVAVGGTVKVLERVIPKGGNLVFVSITIYQAKVGDERRTTVLQRCSAQVKFSD